MMVNKRLVGRSSNNRLGTTTTMTGSEHNVNMAPLQGVPQPLSQLRAQQENQNSPNQQQQQIQNKYEEETTVVTPKTFHFVFTLDCKDPAQDWLGYVFLYSFVSSGQVGEVTQIVTGCGKGGPRQQALQQQFETQIIQVLAADPTTTTTTEDVKNSGTTSHSSPSSSSSRFHIHFAPAHPEQEKVGGLRVHLKYFNKAAGLQHWMEEVVGYSDGTDSTKHDDTVIVVMDADMVILRPFEDGFDHKTELWKVTLEETIAQGGIAKQVQHGRPMAQHSSYAFPWWTAVDDKNIQTLPPRVSEGITKLQSLTGRDIDQHYSAGLPFLLTMKDFYPLVQLWNQSTYPLYQVLGEKILREPHGPYNLAAAVLQQPAQLASTFSVNDFHDAGLNIFHSLLNPVADSHGNKKSIPTCREYPQHLKPHILNYSKRYALGDSFIIGKHYVPVDFVGHPSTSCGQALFVDPPATIAMEGKNYYIDPEINNAQVPIQEPQKVHQMAFLLCETIQALNGAAIHFKQHHCTATNNDGQETTVNMKKTRIGNDNNNG